jgi:hypothetical protein
MQKVVRPSSEDAMRSTGEHHAVGASSLMVPRQHL